MQRARGVRVRILFINLISKLKTATKKKNPCEGHSSRALTESEEIFQRARIASESVLVLMLNAARDVTEHSMFRSGKIRVLHARPSKVGNMVNAARPRKKMVRYRTMQSSSSSDMEFLMKAAFCARKSVCRMTVGFSGPRPDETDTLPLVVFHFSLGKSARN